MSPIAWIAVALSLLFPGAGHGLAGRWRRGLVWAAAAFVTTLLIVVSVWAMPVMMLVRLAGVIDAWRSVRGARGAYDTRWLATAPLVAGVITISAAQASVDAYKIPSSSMSPTLAIGDHIYVDKLSLRWRAPGRGDIVVFTHPCGPQSYIKRVIGVAGDTVELRCGTLYVGGAAVEHTVLGDTRYSEPDHDGRRFWREVVAVRERHGDHTYETYRSRQERPADPEPTHGDFPKRDAPRTPSCTSSDFYPPSQQQGAQRAQPTGTLVETKAASSAGACDMQQHFVVPAGSVFVLGDNRDNANDSRFWGVVPVENIIGRATSVFWPLSRFGAID